MSEKSDELSLDEVYEDTGEETEAKAEESEESTESEEAVSQETDENDEAEDSPPESESEDKGEPEKGDPKSKDEPWQLKAVLDEREKRQKLQAELEELKKSLPKKGKEKTSFFDDEEKARAEIADEIRREFAERELKISERRAVKEFGEEKVNKAAEWFNQKATKYPYLLERFHESGNDISEVVSMYDENQKLSEAGDIKSLEARIRAEVEAELKAEPEKPSKRESIKPSLASQAGSTNSDKPQMESLEEILGR